MKSISGTTQKKKNAHSNLFSIHLNRSEFHHLQKTALRQQESHFEAERSDYFARFRFDLEELIHFLRKNSGVSLEKQPLVFQCLEDLGYWNIVRASSVFVFSDELEEQLRAQFCYLDSIYRYQVNDVLIWGALNGSSRLRHWVRIVEQVTGEQVTGEQVKEDETTLYRVEVIESGATLLVSQFELDFWNGAGSSLPSDQLLEPVNWNADLFWKKRLFDFKNQMVEQGFRFDFSCSSEVMEEQARWLVQEVQRFFSLPPGSSVQRGRGMGYFSCGQGDYEMSAVVVALALQALGQPFGIRSRLWGVEMGFSSGSLQGDSGFDRGAIDGARGLRPSFVLTSVGRPLEPRSDWHSLLIDHGAYRPMQRPLSQVLAQLAAKGPFGRPQWGYGLESTATNKDLDVSKELEGTTGADSD